MKTTTLTTETDNLVLFPSAKNFPLEENLQDPMLDLLNEYSHMTDADIPNHLDDRFENELEDETSFGSLEAFMNRHQSNDTLTPDDKLVKLINERMEAIAEAKQRIKFYLDEIEMFLPRRR
ncbi:hypothetical protein DOM21_10040 [Bacteriovorax stolpii]|uniref:Uncharacterized protein n=1 Tax=Bacteriovorax stolpii TaxID=960 RepID=A0A2K9NU15_BACTC|nr:hypothetical protein [Bacteriovorax stolpii]AUN98234.1 hypothetical protein C0V70_08975 [Bacteriovorax stolpii]QDK41784.1 hypothetical protein DOM21_10040 [Bacteriovorax stolpii]TDP52155.1 hypothetical protein C8D79_2804 [Bacteriovorax stolpii]BDT28342.1 hypothetical protein BHI3_18080 [Bacteriovorax sp. HI3]